MRGFGGKYALGAEAKVFVDVHLGISRDIQEPPLLYLHGVKVDRDDQPWQVNVVD